MPTQYELLGAARVTGILQGLQDPRLQTPRLIWDERIPDVPATDEEILARYQLTLLIADLVADDAKAAVYSQGRFSFETYKIPNIKMGMALNQQMINQLNRLQSYDFPRGDLNLFDGSLAAQLAAVKFGVRMRKEALKMAMLLDGLNYDRLGIKMSGVTWGMPSALKVTAGTAWTSVSATPITDIQTTRRIARAIYGVELDRVTLSTSALQYASATTEFQNQARVFGFGFGGVPLPAIPLQGDSIVTQILARILSGQGAAMTIEIDDRRFWTQDPSGAIFNTPFLPINNVLLTATSGDNNRGVWNFGQTLTTESLVSNASGLTGSVVGRIPQVYGPVGYVTLADPALNAPGLVTWAADRGFPRKMVLASSAVINAGAMTDTIPVGVPFPL